jgi:hypothetical protein
MRYLIILFLLCGSCSTHKESGDFIGTSKYYATRHDHNFQIWQKNNKDIAGLASFKKELSCPEEAHR